MLKSLKVPVAEKDNFVPGAMVRLTGVTEIEIRLALVTVRFIDDAADPTVAEIVQLPGAIPLARPLPAPTFETVLSEDVQVACEVRSCVLPSLKVPIAENCWLVVAAIVVSPG